MRCQFPGITTSCTGGKTPRACYHSGPGSVPEFPAEPAHYAHCGIPHPGFTLERAARRLPDQLCHHVGNEEVPDSAPVRGEAEPDGQLPHKEYFPCLGPGIFFCENMDTPGNRSE